MSILARIIAGLACSAVGVLAAAGAYTEVHHVRDQP